jgi:hypothetical protein
LESGDGGGPSYYSGTANRYAEDRDPLAERPIPASVSLVDQLKAAGREVGDEEWRLGMLGAIIKGRPHHIEAFARHLDKSHAMTLPNGDRLDGVQTKIS